MLVTGYGLEYHTEQYKNAILQYKQENRVPV